MWIHQNMDWPEFKWTNKSLESKLDDLNQRINEWIPYKEFTQEAKLLNGLENEHELIFLTEAVVKSSNIEGEYPDADEVRRSISGRMTAGLDNKKLRKYQDSGEWDGMIEMIMDANRRCKEPLNRKRLSEWHIQMFQNKSDRNGSFVMGDWRHPSPEPTLVATVNSKGEIKKIHYEAPDATLVPQMMENFIEWFESDKNSENLFIKAGVAHLWFELIHPFQDGNGRIGRAICEMILARANLKIYDGVEPFHNITPRIAEERDSYYDILEKMARGTMDITEWLEWFLGCLARSVKDSISIMNDIRHKINVLNLAKNKGASHRQNLVLLQMHKNDCADSLTNKLYRELSDCKSDIIARRDIADLNKLGILVKNPGGGRSTSYRLVTWNELVERENSRKVELAKSKDNCPWSNDSKENNMNEQFITVTQVIEELEKYPDFMKVKIVYFTGTLGVHGKLQFNKIQVSSEKRELQFALDNQKPRYFHDEYVLGELLKQIKDLVWDSGNQTEVGKFLVCKREIGVIIPSQLIEETMYLKHIIPKKMFKSRMFQYDGVDDTIFLEFTNNDLENSKNYKEQGLSNQELSEMVHSRILEKKFIISKKMVNFMRQFAEIKNLTDEEISMNLLDSTTHIIGSFTGNNLLGLCQFNEINDIKNGKYGQIETIFVTKNLPDMINGGDVIGSIMKLIFKISKNKRWDKIFIKKSNNIYNKTDKIYNNIKYSKFVELI